VHRNSALPTLLSVFLLLLARVAVADAAFPRPAELEPDIRFWTRVYTEIDTHHGFIHDARNLAVVYETIDAPRDSRARTKRIERRREHYRTILLKLARGDRDGLDAEEARVLALWPGASNSELRAAAEQLRFQLGQADRFREGWVRAGAWMPHIKRIFADMGLPEELCYLPHVESSFNPNAYSHAAAAGLWQFTSYTGKRYMRIDHVVDERMDPFIATVAAARLLKENYDELGVWPLALTAYNHGVNGMHRAVRTLGTKDIATILRRYQSRSFGFASRNFYVSFLAAVDVERNAERYFGPVERQPEEIYETITVDAYVPAATLAGRLSVDRETLREINPALRPPIWRGEKYVPRGFTLRLPAGSAATAVAALAEISSDQRYTAQRPDFTHRVARGETLSEIAAHYGISVKAIVQANDLRSAHQLRVGQVLNLPTGAIGPSDVAVARTEPAPAVATDGRYVVRRGDTLSKVAARLGVDARALAERNGIADAHLIRVGQVLELPGSPAVAPAVASAGVASTTQYVVRSGDTLAIIAKRHGLTEDQLAALNGIRDRNRIYIGQAITVGTPQGTQGSVALVETAAPAGTPTGDTGATGIPAVAPVEAQPMPPAAPAQ
jgi:membrane-bound lytic murein transglycosylase D